MKHLLATTSVLCLLSTAALAQSATGVGVGQSESNSAAGAVAINRGNGGNVNQVFQAAPANQTINSNVSGGTTNRTELTGTSTVKNVPTAVAPSLAAAGIETCLGSVSGGGSIVGFGGSFGTTVPDPGCQARLDARTLWSMGLKSAAVARLCIREDIYNSMPDICEQYRPRPVVPVGAPNYAYPPGRVAVGREPVMLVEGKTGKERACDVYDQVKFKCSRWTGEPDKKTKVAVVGAKPRKASALASVKPTTVAITTTETTGPVTDGKAVATPQPPIVIVPEKK